MLLIKRTIIAILLLFFISSLTTNFFEYRKNMAFYDSFRTEYEKERKRNITLKTQILKNNDPDQIEKTIRDKLNLLRPNEVAVILPNPTPTTVIISPTPAPPYQQWFTLFFTPRTL